jgi:carbamoyltransferase
MYILGVNYSHDSSATLIKDGKIIANAQEERFTRIKHDSSFPLNAINFCLKHADISSNDIDILAIPYENGHPRLHHYFNFNERQLKESFSESAAKNYLRKKIKSDNTSLPLFIDKIELKDSCEVVRVNHHLSHAASAYLTSGRKEKTLIFSIDGLGDSSSVSIYMGENNSIKLLKSFDRSGSIGWFYSNVTEALGWPHGDGEGTTMGLAPYGSDEDKDKFKPFYPKYKNGELAESHDFGNVYIYNKNESIMFHFEESKEIKKVVDEIGRENAAACVQTILEEQVQDIIYSWVEKTGITDIACAGGVFLNVKMNQNLWYSGKLTSQHIYPDPGDAGLALGASLYALSLKKPDYDFPKLTDLYHGPEYTNEEIESLLKLRKLNYTKLDNAPKTAAEKLADNKIIGWFQGRMEAGPRALGNRSILMSSNSPKNKDVINAEVKFRQGFRPFCPSVLADAFDDYFVNPRDEEYMITSFQFKDDKYEKVPAVVHADKTGRPQKVHKHINERYYNLIKHFGDLTGEYLVLNTSFNIKGEPMICHPKEAIRCFFDNGLDVLFLGDFMIEKNKS